jgi:hypothetical protein
VGGFGELVFEQHDVLGQVLAGPEPEPGLGDVLVGVVPAHLDDAGGPVDVQRVLLDEQVPLHLRHLRGGEAGPTDRALDPRQVAGDPEHVAVVPADAVVGTCGPPRHRRVLVSRWAYRAT